MDTQERIATALEKRNKFNQEILDGVFYAVIGIAIGVIVLFTILIFGGMIYDFFSYDMMGNERLPTISGTVSYQNPIDDCDYSDDKQLCYQMKRIADALEAQPMSIKVSNS